VRGGDSRANRLKTERLAHERLQGEDGRKKGWGGTSSFLEKPKSKKKGETMRGNTIARSMEEVRTKGDKELEAKT